jgi:hypothetical protein
MPYSQGIDKLWPTPGGSFGKPEVLSNVNHAITVSFSHYLQRMCISSRWQYSLSYLSILRIPLIKQPVVDVDGCWLWLMDPNQPEKVVLRRQQIQQHSI